MEKELFTGLRNTAKIRAPPRTLLSGALLLVLSLAILRLARSDNLPQLLGLHGGKQIYQAACAACHGANGEGAAQSSAGFERPATFPHFNKCDESMPEFAKDYTAAITGGGPARGFSQIMPSFSGVLTATEIDDVVTYLRSLCKESDWPVGELNVPRALATEKAFPESETILTTTANLKGSPGFDNEIDYERVLGKRDQLEVAIPFSRIRRQGGGMTAGIGDVAVGDKHVLFSRLNDNAGGPQYESTGSILSMQGEVVLATGDQRRGLGAGEPSLGLFVAYDRLLPHQAFVQLQAGVNLPRHEDRGPRSDYFRSAVGTTVNQAGEFGRSWSPMLEVLANRDLTPRATTDWDVLPEFQVTLNRRQHVRAAIGCRIPVNDTYGRPTQLIAYFLWDWFDGGLFEGW
ncbi:MAG: cytochrome c [Pseudomonadota bacterium]|nr:cytochrome c [Pseudomonadota bacterium]